MMKETLQAFARCELKVEQAEGSGGNGEMDKILTFIVNEYNEILLLKGSENDPQFKKSFWYGVRIDIWTHFMRGCIIDYVH